MCSSNWTMISPYRTTNSSNKIMSDKSLKTQKRKLYDIYSNQLTMACRIQFLRGRLETAGSRFSTRKSVYRLYCFWHKLNVKKKKNRVTQMLVCACLWYTAFRKTSKASCLPGFKRWDWQRMAITSNSTPNKTANNNTNNHTDWMRPLNLLQPFLENCLS